MLSRTNDRRREVAFAVCLTLAAAVLTWVAMDIAGDDVVNDRRQQLLPIALGIGAVIVALPLRTAVYAAGLAAAAWTLAHLGVAVLPDHLELTAPVDQAVGGAAMTGTDYRAPQVGIAVTAALIFAAAAGAAVLRAPRNAAPAAPPQDPARASAGDKKPLALVVATALLAVVFVPELGRSAVGEAASPGWDAENALAWEWAVDRGLSSMNDFFFPYGETWVFYEFPLGPIWEWLGRGATLGFAAWVLWRLGPRDGRLVRAVLGVALFALLAVYSNFYWRYGTGVMLVGAYAALGPAAIRRPGRDHLILAGAATYIGLYDAAVLGQAFVGCAFIVTAELIVRRLRLTRATLGRLAIDALPFVVAGLVLLLVWLGRGSFDESLRWWASARATSAASAPNELVEGALAENISLKPTLEMLFVGAPFLLLAVGFVHLFSADPRRIAAGRLCVGAAGVAFLFLFKHLVRPQFSLTLVAPLLALGWSTILLWTPTRRLATAAAGAFVAALLFSFESGAGLVRLSDKVGGVDERVERSVDVLTDADLRRTLSDQRFDSSPYTAPATTTLANVLREAMAASDEKSFAVLGDAQGVYYLLDQEPPFHVQLYNAAPIEEQEAMVEALAEMEPKFILWRRDLYIDGVPGHVRAPLVYRHTMGAYVPAPSYEALDTTVGYDVLVRREGEPVPVDWWRSRLGDTVDLGFVPYSSGAEDEDECSSSDTECPRYIVATRSGSESGPVTLELEAEGRIWKVTFQTRVDEAAYAIRLDRLWFEPFLGDAPSLRAPAGWTAELKSVDAGDRLY